MNVQVMAAHAACASSTWWEAPWATQILQHPNCKNAASKFHASVKRNEPTTLLLAQLHVCLRHIEAHKGFSIDTKEIVDAYPFADVGSIAQFLTMLAENSVILKSPSSVTFSPDQAAVPTASVSGAPTSANPSLPQSSPTAPSKRRRTGRAKPGATSSHHAFGSATGSILATALGFTGKLAEQGRVSGQSSSSSGLDVPPYRMCLQHGLVARQPLRHGIQRPRLLVSPAFLPCSARCPLIRACSQQPLYVCKGTCSWIGVRGSW